MSLPRNRHNTTLSPSDAQSSSFDCSSPYSTSSSGSQYESSARSSGTSSISSSVEIIEEVKTTSNSRKRQPTGRVTGPNELQELHSFSSNPSAHSSRNSVSKTNEQVIEVSGIRPRQGMKGLKGMNGLKGVKKGMKGVRRRLKENKFLNRLKGHKGKKGMEAHQSDGVTERTFELKDVDKMVDISSPRYSERVPQTKRPSSAYDKREVNMTLPLRELKKPIENKSLSEAEHFSDPVPKKCKETTENVGMDFTRHKSEGRLVKEKDINVNKMCETQMVLKIHTCTTVADQPNECRFEMAVPHITSVEYVCSNSNSKSKTVSETGPVHDLLLKYEMGNIASTLRKPFIEGENIEKNEKKPTKMTEEANPSRAIERPKASHSLVPDGKRHSFHYRVLIGNLEHSTASTNSNDGRENGAHEISAGIDEQHPDEKVLPESRSQRVHKDGLQSASKEDDRSDRAKNTIQLTDRATGQEKSKSVAIKGTSKTLIHTDQTRQALRPNEKIIRQNLKANVLLTGLRSKPISELLPRQVQSKPSTGTAKETKPRVMEPKPNLRTYKNPLIFYQHPDKNRMEEETVAAQKQFFAQQSIPAHVSSNSSLESSSSNEPSPFTISRMKRYHDFVSAVQRAKFITGRMKQLEDERQRMVTIRGKWQRKGIRVEKKEIKDQKRIERNSSDLKCCVQEKSGKEDRRSQLVPEQLNSRNGTKNHSSTRQDIHVSTIIESGDISIPITKDENLSRRNARNDLSPLIDKSTSKNGPLYEPCRPLTMKGRSKEVRDANKAASFGLAKLGGDHPKSFRFKGVPTMKGAKIKMANKFRGAQLKLHKELDDVVNASGPQPETCREGDIQKTASGRKRARRFVDDTGNEDDVPIQPKKKHRGHSPEDLSRQ